MPDPTPNETTATVADLTMQRLDLLAEREKIDLRLADIDAALIEHLPKIGGRFEIDGCPGQGVRYAEPRRTFSDKLAVDVLTPTQYAAICQQKPSAILARQVLPGALVDQLYVTSGKPSIQSLRSGGDRR